MPTDHTPKNQQSAHSEKRQNEEAVKATYKNSSEAKGEQMKPTTDDLIKTVLEQSLWSRLPLAEPTIFSGDPLTFLSWIKSFETLVEKRGIPEDERLHYLRKCVEIEPKVAIEGFLLFPSGNYTFLEAKELLKRRYGNHFIVTEAFRDKLETWPKLCSIDSAGLRILADFLRQCETASHSIRDLKILNDERENRKILQKLPDC